MKRRKRNKKRKNSSFFLFLPNWSFAEKLKMNKTIINYFSTISQNSLWIISQKKRSYLFFYIFVQRIKIFLNQVLPKLDFILFELTNNASLQTLIFDPERIDQIVSFNFRSWAKNILVLNNRHFDTRWHIHLIGLSLNTKLFEC